jgi:ABC-type bacteriocin/lantibiotic exporter with double-glycine peptidase domain
MRDVIYGYKGRPGNVLFAASLEVQPGGLLLVSGPPGSGRSTLLHLLHLDFVAGGGRLEFDTGGGAWLPYHPTTTDRYDMQQRMGFASPQSCIQSVFFATLQENMVCACAQARQPSVADCQEAAALTGLDADVAHLPDGYQTLVGEASRVDLSIMARLLLLHRPLLVLVDDADRFLTAVPRLPEVVARLRQQGAAVLLTATASTVDGLRAALPPDVQCLVLDGGRLKPAA